MIKKSLRLLQLEKFLIILKEMEFISNILKYFKGYDGNNIDNKKVNIQRLENDIQNLQIRIESLVKLNEDMKDINDVNFVIFYNYVRTQIEEMLLVINALYTKMNQLFGEMLNQYLPYPTFFGRRYSSHGVMMYLDNYYNYIYEKLLEGDITNEIILTWGHSTNFKYKILRNRDIKRINYNKDTHNDYIELPYWYYELPFLIPAITHEVVFLSLKSKSGKKDTKIFKKYQKFHDKLELFYTDRLNYLVQEIGDILGYKQIVKEISKDIFCDVVAYKLHSTSYLYTLMHNIFGESISKNFIQVIYDSDGKTIKKYEILPNDWFFSPKKDHNFLRLYFLCDHILVKLDKDDYDFVFVKELKSLLDSIMSLEDDKISSFEKLYMQNYPNYYPTFLVVKNYLSQIFEYIKGYDFELENIINEILKSNKKYFYNFDFLWKNRFDIISQKDDIVPRKGLFRKSIHNIVSKLDNIEENVYVLILRKYRKDKYRFLEKDFDFDVFLQETYDHDRWMAYGIYDMVFVEKKDVNIDLFDELKDIKNSINDQKEMYFFDSKQLLMKLEDKSIENKVDENNNNLNIILNIEIKKDRNHENGYHDLENAVGEIYEIFQTKKNFHKVDIYKSLGPKDLTVVVQKIDIDDLFFLINQINKVPEINRTFSIFCSNNKNINIKSKRDKYFFVTYIRVPKDKKTQIEYVFKKLHCVKIFQTSGVMDYTIIWENIFNLEELFEQYKKIIEYVTDFQTKIEKRFQT